jgi:hypothetical protein
MSTETSTMPNVVAPTDPTVGTAAPKEVDKQPSTQLESESALPSEAPASAESTSVAIETMSQAQDEEDSTGETPVKEGDFALTNATDVNKTESSPVDNSENQKGQKTSSIHSCVCKLTIFPAVSADQVADESEESAEAAASAPATPSKNADDASIMRVKRSISELEEPTVPAKVLKV